MQQQSHASETRSMPLVRQGFLSNRGKCIDLPSISKSKGVIDVDMFAPPQIQRKSYPCSFWNITDVPYRCGSDPTYTCAQGGQDYANAIGHIQSVVVANPDNDITGGYQLHAI